MCICNIERALGFKYKKLKHLSKKQLNLYSQDFEAISSTDQKVTEREKGYNKLH